MKRLIAATLAACLATPVLAWGPREQGALAGVVGTILFQHVTRDGRIHQPYPVYGYPPVVVHQPQMVIGPSPYCPPGTGYFGHEMRTFTDQWGRYWNTPVPICR